jgi:hypothetical protein
LTNSSVSGSTGPDCLGLGVAGKAGTAKWFPFVGVTLTSALFVDIS